MGAASGEEKGKVKETGDFKEPTISLQQPLAFRGYLVVEACVYGVDEQFRGVSGWDAAAVGTSSSF